MHDISFIDRLIMIFRNYMHYIFILLWSCQFFIGHIFNNTNKKEQMGNNIGFEVDDETVKLAYVQEDPKNIAFIRGLKSKYLKSDFNRKNATVFLFQCSMEEFQNYPTSQNVKLLRDQYNSILASEKCPIKTNRQTINKMKRNQKLNDTLKAILMTQFQLIHQERIETSVQSINLLEKSEAFFTFSNLFKLTELHQTFPNLQKSTIKKIPQDSLILMLRGGTTAYRLNSGKKVNRIGGSIIGQKSIMSILRLKNPGKSRKQIFQLAMNSGNLKNVDMMIQDIYGKNTSKLGLPADMIASSLGKYGKMSPSELAEQKDEDIARSLITSFAINIASIASIFGREKQIQGLIVLADQFHDERFYYLVQSILDVFIPGKQIMFFRHSPFIGCLGSALEKQ